MEKKHSYQTRLKWTGNRGRGTLDYRAYDRDYVISSPNKPEILGSSDFSFFGDKRKYNPEDMLVASLSACHMLCYLHVCAVAGVVITDYVDNATGTMTEAENGGGKFRSVTLYPTVTVLDDSMVNTAAKLHHEAHKLCFIASSVNFPVTHQATIKTVSDQ